MGAILPAPVFARDTMHGSRPETVYPLLPKGSCFVNISSYESLLEAANKQAKPQRLLFVFTKAGLPDDHTRDQEKQFNARKGGTLTPVMCVDKLASERMGFASLVEESRQTEMDWDIVFVACMDSQSGIAPNNGETEQPFKAMISSIQSGSIGNYLAFNRDGEMIRFR